jgi:hypothetical protein
VSKKPAPRAHKKWPMLTTEEVQRIDMIRAAEECLYDDALRRKFLLGVIEKLLKHIARSAQ